MVDCSQVERRLAMAMATCPWCLKPIPLYDIPADERMPVSMRHKGKAFGEHDCIGNHKPVYGGEVYV